MAENTTEKKSKSEPSKLDKLVSEFETTFKGKTNDKRTKELVSAFVKAQSARAAADAAADKAAKAEQDAAEAIIRECSGRARITIGNDNLSPMCRGDKVFFRRENAETVVLG